MTDIAVIFVAGVIAVVSLRLAYGLLIFRGKPRTQRGLVFNARENRFEPTENISDETVDQILGA